MALLVALAGIFSAGLTHAQDNPSLSASPVPSSPASSAEEPTLPTVSVTAQSERETLTEFSGSYTTGATTVTTKLPLTLRETPQTITVITRQQMDDFGLNSVNEVLQSTSSVYVEKRGLYTVYTSRGFSLQSQYDGIANPTYGASPYVSPDSAFLDHIEVQQGAAGLLTGAGQPGGTINLVRKRPTEAFQIQAEAEFGSWDKKRLVGDISGPLTQSGVLRGRAVVVFDKSDSFIDYVFGDRNAFYGALELVPNTETKIGLGLQIQKDKYRLSNGEPVNPNNGHDLSLGHSTFFGEPHHDGEQERLSAFLYLEQKLPNDWVFKANYAHNKTESDDFSGSPFGSLDVTTGGGLGMLRDRDSRKTEADAVDAHASGPVQLFGRRHEFALGVNGTESKFCAGGDLVDNVIDNIYTYRPSDLPVYDLPADCGDTDRTRQHGVWGVARLNLADSLKLIVGTRVSWYEYTNWSGVKTMEENGVVSPYAGIIYDLNQQLSVYASYSDIFNPQTAMDRKGNVLEPVVGANYEVGIKGEFLDKRLNAAAAIFRLEQTNLAAQDTDFGHPNAVCPGWCSIAQGLIVSKGVDLSLNGALSDNWNVNVGYTFANSEYATGANKGDRTDHRIPKHIFRVATTYRIPGSGWTVGGNLQAQSKVLGYRDIRIKQSGYALLGLMAKYQINPQAEISITANNVLDQEYRYPNVTDSTHYGDPRSVFASVKYRF